MFSKFNLWCFLLLLAAPGYTIANPTRILADTFFLKSMGITPLSIDPDLHLSIAEVSEYQADTLSHAAHRFGKCGGFERLPEDTNIEESFSDMKMQKAQSLAFAFIGNPLPDIPKQANIEAAVQRVSEENIRTTVTWLSQYYSRFHRGQQSNKAVDDLAQKITDLLSGAKIPFQIDLIAHSKTPQKSIRVRFLGRENPQEVVILGGHLDSIANWGIGKAPGADDNASGSADLLEAVRLVSTQEQPARTIEFFWYAGEEGGLIGSSEIAQTYKQSGTEVIGVMQLDMTLYPGDGELVIGDMNDFTNPWLRSYMRALNEHYIGARWKEDQCGYGCSDHASWHRQGYAAVMPFEAGFNGMNQNIHTSEDLITPALNFKHSAAFAKLAVAFALDLGNSKLKPTF